MLLKGKEKPLFSIVQMLDVRVVRGILEDNCKGYAAQIAFFMNN
jgi:hypothetical protein